MRSLVVSVFLVLLGASATAGVKAGIRMPDQIVVGGETLRLNGMGLREATAFKVDVYVAGLYLEQPTPDPATIIRSQQSKVLVLRFVRDVDREDIVKAWRDGFARNATVPVISIQASIDQLEAWTPKFRKGDTLTFGYVPGQGVLVEINGAVKGTIQGEDFARSLFSIWVGPHPPNSGLKRGLLGTR
jgi:hypothetical protein